MNSYEIKQEARRECLLSRANRLRAAARRLAQYVSLQAGISKAVLPEHRERFFEHSFATESFRPGRALSYFTEPTGSIPLDSHTPADAL